MGLLSLDDAETIVWSEAALILEPIMKIWDVNKDSYFKTGSKIDDELWPKE